MLLCKLLPRLALPGLIAAAAFSTAAWAGPHSVPFKASVTTTETLLPNPAVCPAFPFLTGTTTGSGNASHMGAITFVSTDCVMPSPTSFSFSDGKLTVTGANGDEVRAVYNGELLPVPDAAPFTLFTVSGSYSIVGGTGRFAGATGSGALQGTTNIVTKQGQIELRGTISY